MNALRRHHDARMKARAKHKLSINGLFTDPRTVGKAATMHNTCDCWMCTTKFRRPDKYKGARSPITT